MRRSSRAAARPSPGAPNLTDSPLASEEAKAPSPSSPSLRAAKFHQLQEAQTGEKTSLFNYYPLLLRKF